LALNLTALTLIAFGWTLRDLTTLRPGVGTVALEIAGLAVMTVGGWLGGTLVYRNQIGVDHRYAEAGKWAEVDLTGKAGESVDVAAADELKVGQMKLLHVNGRRIVLARTEEGHVAFDDHCTHRGGSLADGTLACGTVTCPWHGSQYDAATGAVKSGPTTEPIRTYRVEESGGRVRLVVPTE
jgi:nitrite reductase/ring-hydroxylating ferredoxin subunit